MGKKIVKHKKQGRGKKDEKTVAQRQLGIMNQWFILKQNNMPIDCLLLERGWKNVAIYGMGIYGRHLVRELKSSNQIHVMCGIDAHVQGSFLDTEIVKLEDVAQAIDGVINTVFYDGLVEKEIKNKLQCEVISLEDLIFESYVIGGLDSNDEI